jgi:uncharacterized protein YkwD
LRRLAAAILAVPILASVYLAALLSVPGARRYLAAVGAIMLVGVIGVGFFLPGPAASVPPSSPTPIPGDLFQPVSTGQGNTAAASPSQAEVEAVQVAAATAAPQDRPVASAVIGEVAPDATAAAVITAGAVSAASTKSATRPTATTSGITASARKPTTVKLSGSHLTGNNIKLTSAIVMSFDRPVSLKAVRAAFAISPTVKGTIKAVTNRLFRFTPTAALKAGTTYTVSFKKSLTDTNAKLVAAPKASKFSTPTAPSIVRFRPTRGTTSVDPTQLLSVRFSQPMNHATTQRAFSVVIAGRRVPGSISWAENNTVLVFTPTRVLPKGAGVGIRIAGTATALTGVPLKSGGSATFKVVPAPKATVAAHSAAKPAAKPVVKPVSKPHVTRPRSGGGSVGGGSWAAAEQYYLDLMNCTRTGGWVLASGACSGYGSRGVAPLWIDSGISANVSRPYARYLAETGICSHFADGNPGTRLRRAGYDSYKWAENISCPKPMSAMGIALYTQIYFEDERSYNGGHYVNLMNPLYDRVGIGIWVAGNGNAEVVIDFYRP